MTFYTRHKSLPGVGWLLAALLFEFQLEAVAALPPGIIIESVSPVDPVSGNVQVSGSLDVTRNYTSLDINGYTPTSFDGKLFAFELPPAAEYRIHLYDAAGGSQSLDYSAPGTAIRNAIQVQVGKQLLADASPALETLLANLDLQALLGVDPNKCLLDINWLMPCDLYLKQMAIQGTPDIRLGFTPDNGKRMNIDIAITIPQATLETRTRRPFLWSYNNSRLVVRDISVAIQVGVEATSRQSIRLVLDRPSDVRMAIGRITVGTNNISADVMPLFKNAITGFVNTQLVNIAGPLLSKLEIPGIPLSLPLDIDGDGADDAQFDLNISAELLDVLDNGDGVAALAGSIGSATTLPGRDVLGFRRVPGVLPATNGVTAPTDLLAQVHVDLVNQVLMSLYQSGLEQKLALPMKVSDMGSFAPTLVALGYAADQTVNIHIAFGAQPELLVRNDALYPLGLQVFLPKARMLVAAVNADGSEAPLIDMIADMSVATSLGADPDGTLHLEFQDLIAMDIRDILGGDLGTLFPPEPMKAIIAFALPQMLTQFEPMIAELLNAARLELDIGQLLNDFLKTNQFQSVPVQGYITETEVSDDEAYLGVGIGIDFP